MQERGCWREGGSPSAPSLLQCQELVTAQGTTLRKERGYCHAPAHLHASGCAEHFDVPQQPKHALADWPSLRRPENNVKATTTSTLRAFQATKGTTKKKTPKWKIRLIVPRENTGFV